MTEAAAGSTAPTIDPATGAPPPPPAPVANSATAPATVPTEPTAPVNTSTPTEQREATIAATAGVMPDGALPPKEGAPQEGAKTAPDTPEQMPSGIITAPNSDWQVAAEGPPEDGYKDFTVGMGLGEDGKPVREDWKFEAGENPIYDRFMEDIKTRGLSQEQAQTELDRIGEYSKMAVELVDKAQVEQAKEWNKELHDWGYANNPEIKRNVAAALKYYDTNGRLRQALENSGAGNMPEVARILSDLGRFRTEGPGFASEQTVMTPNAGPKPVSGTQPSRTYMENMEILARHASQGNSKPGGV